MPKFSSKIGVIAATVGSAVGLGNVWRFPAETQANGGAVFLIIYAICIVILGIPVMTSELALGRGGDADAYSVFGRITPNKKGWSLVGGLNILSSFLVLSFYMVVAAWTLEYLIQSVTGALYANAAEGEAGFRSAMGDYITGVTRPIVMTEVMIVANLIVLIRGVEKGIERLSNILMPLLFVLLVTFCCVSLSLPGAREGMEFFLRPDFSKLTVKTVVNALGQSFFSLSLATGIIITYGSYYPASTRLTRTSAIVSVLDLLVAVLMGIIIFPGVMTFGLEDSNLAGSALVFVTLPEIFAQMGGTQLWSSLFFLLLVVAAFTSTISLAEVSVSFVKTVAGVSRTRACWLVCLPLMVLSPVCSLSVGAWSGFTICGMTIFDFLDTFATNLLMPLGGLLLCVYVGWIAPKNFLYNEVTNRGTLRSGALKVTQFTVRWIAPPLILVILISQFI